MVAMDEHRFRTAEARLWASVGVTPTERRVTLPGPAGTVRLQEIGDGPTVLFVHGGANAGSSWAPLVARLPGFQCVMLDRPGCGLSDRIDPPLADITAIESFADAMIPNVLDALELARAHVVSTSFGGYFALRAAAAHPDRIDRMVEFGWTIGAPIDTVPLPMRVTSIPALGRLMARVPPTERAVRMMLRQIGLGAALASGRFTQEAVDWYLALLRDTPTLRNELASTPRVIRPVHGMDERVLLAPTLLAAVRAPIRFVWGDDDPNGGAECARRFVAQLPHAELDLRPGVGHAPWMDDPEYAAGATREFLGP
jgi:pimeloyl-ACP methyl ester carboxylesterase